MAQNNFGIKNIEEVVKDGKVQNIEISRLTVAGENYASLVLKVNFDIEKLGQIKKISSVAKCFPLGSNLNSGSPKAAFMKAEIKWYADILPILKSFASEYEIDLDFYPQYYGSRFSLDSSKKEPDKDTILLIENLIPSGYLNEDRFKGFDLKTSEAILKNLAIFHAVPIALKLTKPEKFEIIKEFLKNSNPFKGPPGGQPVWKGEKGQSHETSGGQPVGMDSIATAISEAMKNISGMAPYLSKVLPLLSIKGFPKDYGHEPWNTISHNDLWVNNIMIKPQDGQEPLVKFVDFQMLKYRSFASDLVFFLLTSVRNDIMVDHFDHLLRFYYEEFIKILKKFNLDLNLTFNEFLKEVGTTAEENGYKEAVGKSTVLFGDQSIVIDAGLEEFHPPIHIPIMIKKMNQVQKDKLVLMTSEVIKRHWI